MRQADNLVIYPKQLALEFSTSHNNGYDTERAVLRQEEDWYDHSGTSTTASLTHVQQQPLLHTAR